MPNGEERVNVISPDGELVSVPVAQMTLALERGFRPAPRPPTTVERARQLGRFALGTAAEIGPETVGAALGGGLGGIAGGAAGLAGGPAAPATVPAGAAAGIAIGSVLGGAGGEAFQQLFNRIFPQTAPPSGVPQTGLEAGGRIAEAGAFGPLQEAGRLVRPATRLAAPITQVPLLRSERTGAALSQFLEGVAERTVPGARRFALFRGEQRQALLRFAEDVVEKVSPSRLTSEEVGLVLGKERTRALEKFGERSSELYAAIDRAAGGVQVSTGGLKTFAGQQLKRIKAEEKLIPAKELERVRALLTRITKSPKRVAFQTVQDARSTLLAITRGFGDPVPGKAGGVAKRLAGLADEAMIEAARKVPGLEQRVRAANQFYREGIELFNESVMARILETAPERIPGIVRRGSLEDIRTVRQVATQETFQAIKSRILRDILDEATSGELRPTVLGKLREFVAPVGEDVPRLSSKSLNNKLEKLGIARLGELFTQPGEFAAIQELLDVTSRAGRQAKGGGLLIVPAAVNAFLLIGTPIQVLRGQGVGETLTAAAVLAGTLNLMARAMTRVEGTRAMSQLVRARTPGAARFWATRLMTIGVRAELQAEPVGRVRPIPQQVP